MKSYYAKRREKEMLKLIKILQKRMDFGINLFSISSYTSMARIKNARLYVWNNKTSTNRRKPNERYSSNGGYMLTCALGSLVAAVITGYITSRISSNFSKTIRKNYSIK